MSAAWVTILVAGPATFAMRASFLAFAHRMATVPTWAQRVLRQIPPAALASIVVPALVRSNGTLDLWSSQLAAGLVAGLVAWRSKNIAITLVVGMALLVVLDQL